ncbi:glycosyltransferase family 4 protein [Roseomonas sp. OT10]|uniref:glycosyltransferase family 4 protein n=1 Tax=Roseomonas cutis TaxID=2897332 RepID=UPI001E5AAD88|nr:glycosyltransferase family 4 protein [Roseomonas sp. OT10]UFN49850.1 glycosyltransferase family 4 protein [Roseomonas sp. OT10]
MSQPPTVLQVLPALVSGGVERGTVEIAEALAGAGFRALVASAGGPLVAELEAVGARHATLPLDRKSPLALAANARALERLIRAEGVDIVHARSRFPAWSALAAARRTGARFVTTFHGVYSESFPGKRLYNSVMVRGDRVIAISEHVAGIIHARYGTGPDRLRIIPRGADVTRFDPAAVPSDRVAALRAAWAVPEGRPVVLLPGRLTRWKGQAVLLRALARLLPDPPFGLLVGEGGMRAELEAEARRLGLAGHVALPGLTRDMPAALLLADLVVHASTAAEPFGRTVVEAQAMRRPVIAADLGAPRETVEEGVTGWRVPPDDPEALAAAIRRALALPPEARAALGIRARAAVLARYTTAAMQAATLNVYRELL